MVPVPRKTLVFLVSLFFLIFCYCSSHTFGQTQHDDSGSGGDLVVRRLAPGEELTDRKLAVLSKGFSLDSTFLKDRYSYRYNAAVSEASRGNFKPMASIAAELFGTLNNRQVETFLADLKAEKESEQKKTPPDARFLSFLDIFTAAAERVLDPKSEGKTQEQVDFLNAFDPEFTKIKESNGRFNEKVKQALEGNNAAKEFLRSQYDPKALLSFMDAQRATGNEELARNLAKSLSEFDDSGNHSIDFNGPAGKERLTLGKSDAEIDNSLSQFSSKEGFGGRSFSPTRHAAPDKTFPLPSAGGEPATQQPSGDAGSAQPGPLKEDATSSSTTSGAPPSGGKPATAAAFAMMKDACVKCHGPGKRQEQAFSLNEDGSPANKIDGQSVSAVEAMTRVLTRTLVDKDMPPTGELSASQQQILRAWAAEQNVAIPK